MAVERTLSIIKPDGVARGLIGEILGRFEKAGFTIAALRRLHLTAAQAEGFYAVHQGKPFFEKLVRYMTSGPVVVAVLEGEGAIQRNREIMGATDPLKAAAGTIRQQFGVDITTNTVHGSDAPQTAAFEIGYFFPSIDLLA
ncbi:MAG: nucleoside-diphosphate kinase [Bradymonadales bacterium]|nr:nucleoside-diphosphate kinase [Bradymonadales bacterium]